MSYRTKEFRLCRLMLFMNQFNTDRYRNRLLIILYLVFSLLSFGVSAAEGDHHPHHVALATGIAWYDSKNSVYLGADYVYSWENGWGVGGFYEEVNGDFELQVIGLLISRNFHNGWKLNFGPGVEHKIEKNKNLALFRVQTGYGWHSGGWSWGPDLTVDLIEDGNTTYYAGFSVGYGW